MGHLPCVELALSPKWPKRASILPTSPRCSIGCAQNDFQARGAFNTNHAPIWAEINTFSKQTEVSFHLTYITLEFHRVCPKRFLSQLHRQCKPCTYLVSRLALSPKRPKRASIWPTLSWSSIGCTENDSKFMVRPSERMHLHCAEINTISKWTKRSFH
jgi:hypothetical protein